MTVAPAFPIWIIATIVVATLGLRAVRFILSSRRNRPTRAAALRFGAGTLAILCLGLAALRIGDESRAEQPSLQTTTADESNINVFFVVDRSTGMLTKDFDGGQTDRLTGAVGDMLTITRRYPHARYAVLSYAQSGRVDWPLSPDVWSLGPFLGNFTPYGGDGHGVQATNVAAASPELRGQLEQAARTYPGSADLVYVFGSPSDPGDWAYDVPRGLVSGGAVFGYGTTQAQPPLNEAAMKTAAESLGIPYYQRSTGMVKPDQLAALPKASTPAEHVAPGVPHPGRAEYYWLFTALAVALFGVELYTPVRRWLRSMVEGAPR